MRFILRLIFLPVATVTAICMFLVDYMTNETVKDSYNNAKGFLSYSLKGDL